MQGPALLHPRQQTEQPPWQGTQGPTIRSEVGDLVEIMFLNRLSRNYATVHSMGLTCIKADGGATYANVTDPGRNITLGEADAVPPSNVYEGVEPGGCVVYKWMVEEDSGPDEGDVSKVGFSFSFLVFTTPFCSASGSVPFLLFSFVFVFPPFWSSSTFS